MSVYKIFCAIQQEWINGTFDVLCTGRKEAGRLLDDIRFKNKHDMKNQNFAFSLICSTACIVDVEVFVV